MLIGDKEYCFDLSIYLRDELNRQYRELRELKYSKEGVILPLEVIVKKAVNYDAITPTDLSQFPLLKVYRTSDQYNRGRTTSRTTASIAYCLSFPEIDLLPDILTWVSKTINLCLLSYQRDHRHLLPPDDKLGYRANYLIQDAATINAVYPFLKFDINFTDTINC